MNPDDPNVQTWLEPELEARIVASLLDETSAFEEAELERLMNERPEMVVFHRRLQAVHGLLGEASNQGPDDDWKLSKDRRTRVLQTLRPGPGPVRSKIRPVENRRRRRVVWMNVAASVAILPVIAGLVALGFRNLDGSRALLSSGTKSAATHEVAMDSEPEVVEFNGFVDYSVRGTRSRTNAAGDSGDTPTVALAVEGESKVNVLFDTDLGMVEDGIAGPVASAEPRYYAFTDPSSSSRGGQFSSPDLLAAIPDVENSEWDERFLEAKRPAAKAEVSNLDLAAPMAAPNKPPQSIVSAEGLERAYGVVSDDVNANAVLRPDDASAALADFGVVASNETLSAASESLRNRFRTSESIDAFGEPQSAELFSWYREQAATSAEKGGALAKATSESSPAGSAGAFAGGGIGGRTWGVPSAVNGKDLQDANGAVAGDQLSDEGRGGSRTEQAQSSRGEVLAFYEDLQSGTSKGFGQMSGINLLGREFKREAEQDLSPGRFAALDFERGLEFENVPADALTAELADKMAEPAVRFDVATLRANEEHVVTQHNRRSQAAAQLPEAEAEAAAEDVTSGSDGWRDLTRGGLLGQAAQQWDSEAATGDVADDAFAVTGGSAVNLELAKALPELQELEANLAQVEQSFGSKSELTADQKEQPSQLGFGFARGSSDGGLQLGGSVSRQTDQPLLSLAPEGEMVASPGVDRAQHHWAFDDGLAQESQLPGPGQGQGQGQGQQQGAQSELSSGPRRSGGGGEVAEARGVAAPTEFYAGIRMTRDGIEKGRDFLDGASQPANESERLSEEARAKSESAFKRVLGVDDPMAGEEEADAPVEEREAVRGGLEGIDGREKGELREALALGDLEGAIALERSKVAVENFALAAERQDGEEKQELAAYLKRDLEVADASEIRGRVSGKKGVKRGLADGDEDLIEPQVALVDKLDSKPDEEIQKLREERVARAKVGSKTRRRVVRKSQSESNRARAVIEEKEAREEPYSTFSLHVSDVAFKLAKAALLDNHSWPEVDKVRVEEFVNAFDYGDPAPSLEEKVACRVEQAAHPFRQQRNLLRVAMRTADVGRVTGMPLQLTLLLDTSGSMERADRQESIQRAMQILTSQLTPNDTVTLIGFARQPRLIQDRLTGEAIARLPGLVRRTPSEGGTNLEEALLLGGEHARRQYVDGGQNRIVLLTDGAANLGDADAESLGEIVVGLRQEGIAFDACGVGAKGLNDTILEALTRRGDGRYYFLDRPEDADAGFARQLAGAFRPAARNVKIQVRFNESRVGRYRLLGFEKHRLKKEDFRNDQVDAVELASSEAGVALYEVEALASGEGEIGEVSVRFQDMTSGRMVERMWTIPYQPGLPGLDQASPTLQLAGTAAFLAEKLKRTAFGEMVDLDRLAGITTHLRQCYGSSARVADLIAMIEKVKEL